MDYFFNQVFFQLECISGDAPPLFDGPEFACKFTEAILLYGLAEAVHEIEQEIEVVDGIQAVTKKLPGKEKVPQVGAGIVTAGVAIAAGADRAGIAAVFRVADP